jgi:hypothetical protein
MVVKQVDVCRPFGAGAMAGFLHLLVNPQNVWCGGRDREHGENGLPLQARSH